MSFANIDLEAQKQPLVKKSPVTNYHSTASPTKDDATEGTETLEMIIQKTSEQLQHFNQLISQFDSQRRQLGSKRDSIQLRNNIDALVEDISSLYTAIQSLMSNLSLLINRSTNANLANSSVVKVSSRQTIMKERLNSEFHNLDKKFRHLVTVYKERKDMIILNEREPAKEESDEQHQMQKQTQMEQEVEDPDLVEQTELQYHLLLTEERNREIEQVSEGIMEVNAIFKDLNQLLHSQGDQINSIEDNILQLHGHTQQAERELHKAHEYGKKKGKWSCILLIAMTVFLLVVVLIVIS
ncbi:VAM3 [Candida oxycetoniae]|uniref:VAM3 n=1 Tax=Candida oxycetoniae TaxID=497107 RepID=A0AAI9T032_9ASCO|nr:VAM3 [Candida oxycetoniae]KAI3406177.2 VAM3 [Candida oxycetoniae]